jgi:molecular chaperone DnaK
MVVRLNRAKFEDMTRHLVDRCRGPFEAAVRDAGTKVTDINEVVLVGGATRMPMVQDLVRSLVNKEPNKGVNPDEVVAIGAAIQAGVLAGEVKDVLLLDVTPLSLGVETMGSVMTTLIERNTTIPVRKTETFSTAEDSQTAVDVHVLQGERPMAADNMSLGRFRLEGIPPAPRGVPQVEVTFDIDANGILNVTARDKATNREQKVTITASTNLNKNDIERMVGEAKKHEADDRRRRELADVRNTADNLVYQAERALRDLGERVAADVRTDVEAKINSVRQAMQSDDINRIRRASEELTNVVNALSQQMYAQGQAAPQGGGPQTGPQGGQQGGDDVVEGEFREA